MYMQKKYGANVNDLPSASTGDGFNFDIYIIHTMYYVYTYMYIYWFLLFRIPKSVICSCSLGFRNVESE